MEMDDDDEKEGEEADSHQGKGKLTSVESAEFANVDDGWTFVAKSGKVVKKDNNN